MEIKQPKKPEIRTKVDFLFEKANIVSKSQLANLAENSRKSQLFETNIDLDESKLATFWDKGGTLISTLGSVSSKPDHPPRATP